MDTAAGKQVKWQGDTLGKNSYLNKELPYLELHGMKMEKEKDDLRAQLQILEEIKNVLEEQNRFLNVIWQECQKLKLDTENGPLMVQLKFLQENEENPSKDNEFLLQALAGIQNQSVRISKQNENLCAVAKVLKKNVIIINESTEYLISDLCQIETQSDKNQMEIHRLRAELQTVRSMLQDRDDLIRRTDENVTKNAFLENKNMTNKLHDIEENNTFLKNQNEMIRDELENNKSVQNQQCQKIVRLKTSLKARERFSEQVHFLLYSKNEMIEKQKREIDYQREGTEELNTLNSSLRLKIRDLQSQLEQMEELFVTKKCNECLMKKPHFEEPIDPGLLDLNTEDKDFTVQIKDNQQDTAIEKTPLFNLSTVLFEPPSLRMETENEGLKARVKVREGTENNLIYKIKSLRDEVALLTCRCEKMEIKEEELRTQVKFLGRQCPLDDKNTFPDVLADVETLGVRTYKQNEAQKNDTENGITPKKRRGTWLADLSQFESSMDKNPGDESRMDKNQGEMYCKRTAAPKKSEWKDENEITREMDDEEEGWAENERLCNQLHDLEENKFLMEDVNIRKELDKENSVLIQQCHNIAQPTSKNKNDVQLCFCVKDHTLTVQEWEVADQPGITDEINTPNITVTQTTYGDLSLLKKVQGETSDTGMFLAKLKAENKDLRPEIIFNQLCKDTENEPNELTCEDLRQNFCLNLKIQTDSEEQETKSSEYHCVFTGTKVRTPVENNENNTNNFEKTEIHKDNFVKKRFEENDLSKDSALHGQHNPKCWLQGGGFSMEKTWSDNERLRYKLHRLHEQNKIVREVLEEYASLREEHFANLKKAILNDNFPVDEEQYQHYLEDKLEQYQLEITELKHLMIRLKQTNFDLEGQFEQKIKRKKNAAICGEKAEDPVNYLIKEPRIKHPVVDGLLETEFKEDTVLREPRTKDYPTVHSCQETEPEVDSVDTVLKELRTEGESFDQGLLKTKTEEEEDSADVGPVEPRIWSDPFKEGHLKTETEEFSIDEGILEKSFGETLEVSLQVTKTDVDPIDAVILEPTPEENAVRRDSLKRETGDYVNERTLQKKPEQDCVTGRLLATESREVSDERTLQKKSEHDCVTGRLLATEKREVRDESFLDRHTERHHVNKGLLESKTVDDLVCMDLKAPRSGDDSLYQCITESTTEDKQFHKVLLKFIQIQTKSVHLRAAKKIMKKGKKCVFAVIKVIGILLSGAIVFLKIVHALSELCECLDVFQNF